jgi:glycyl-tRNA synthetase beta chain
MKTATLLIEIGCEEIPARMIPAAVAQFGERILALLDQRKFAHGIATTWGGSRRLAVSIDAVQCRQADREETVLGPPAKIGLDSEGQLTKAAIGFAQKKGISPETLETIKTDKGDYLGFEHSVAGQALGEILAGSFSSLVEKLFFPKMMRWGSGEYRWVRPVHWLVAMHGPEILPLSLFGVSAGSSSMGHRFLSSGAVDIDRPENYLKRLEDALVVVQPELRQSRIQAALDKASKQAGGELIPDPDLLSEVSQLIEWPGVVCGEFPRSYLALPRELLVTTLRYHQKCFSIQSARGELMPGFLAIANTDRDPSGHIKRGNEWVVAGRLEDARYFWNEDRKHTLATRSSRLSGMILHSEIGTYADKARRMQQLAGRIAGHLTFAADQIDLCREAAFLAKNDLLSGTVGEFPELQGIVGGLLLGAEGANDALARAVYEHYRPAGPTDTIPESSAGCIVAVADKLDNLAGFVGIGQAPTGSRDPFGLRRAANGLFRIIIDCEWEISIEDLVEFVEGDSELVSFLTERLQSSLKELGFTVNEVRAVFRPKIQATQVMKMTLPDLVARLEAIKTVRSREDFAHLVDLTKRVDNIVTKNSTLINGMQKTSTAVDYVEKTKAATVLAELIDARTKSIHSDAAGRRYMDVVKQFAEFIDPVELFFEKVLVLDPEDVGATHSRIELVVSLNNLLTDVFDIRELAGQASRRNS